jgi:large subunit ribosomal protein L9
MKGKTQKLLLNESVKHVGRVGDVVEVSSGYARNYLIPKGIAVQPTANNLKKVEALKVEAERVEKEIRAKQETLIGKLANVEVAIERRANEYGNLFGSVSATDISKALAAMGHDVAAEDVYLPGKLDKIDKYNVDIGFADDLRTTIKVYVSPDPDSKVAIDAYQKDRAAQEAANPPAPKPAAAAPAEEAAAAGVE